MTTTTKMRPEEILEYPVIVVVFAMDGCGGCESYKPKFEKVRAKWSECIPSVVIDAEKHEQLSNLFRVRATPSTFISFGGRKSAYQLVGDAPEEDIESVFEYASMGEGCEIG